MDSELDRTQGWWDDASCREFEAFLDEMADDSAEEEWAEIRMAEDQVEWEKERGNLGDF